MKKETAIKRCQRKVEKLNQFVRDAIAECGGETDLYLDNSSTIISTPDPVSPDYNINEDGQFCVGENSYCNAYVYDEEEDEWYIDSEFDETIRWEKACIRRGVRYFKEYNPDWDEDEEKAEEFINNL